jgi:hypothetical protein
MKDEILPGPIYISCFPDISDEQISALKINEKLISPIDYQDFRLNFRGLAMHLLMHRASASIMEVRRALEQLRGVATGKT